MGGGCRKGMGLKSTTERRTTNHEQSPKNGLTRNTARSWWIALDTMKKPESCLKKLDWGVSRKRRNWATQQKPEVNKLELRNQHGRTWEKLLLEYFENKMRAPSSAIPQGKSLHQNWGSVAVHVVPGWDCAGGFDLMRQVEVGR